MRLHVTADDRTGALEVAAALADRGVGGGAGVTVAVWPTFPDTDVCVVDLASRHLAPADAALRAAELASHGPAAHKIDSTLRGNWAHELVARHAATGMPVLLVPALPALGRTCVGGEVLVDGVPVHAGVYADDARHELASSRPAVHLQAAGAHDVVELAWGDDVAAWLARPTGCVVVDAATDADIESVVSSWREAEAPVLLAGTSAVIAASAGVAAGLPDRAVDPPVLVVCGSAGAVARRQLDVAVEAGARLVEDRAGAVAALAAGVPAIVASAPPGGRVSPDAAEAVAESLAELARSIAAAVPELGTMIVIGGDTAAAVLGDDPVQVVGSVTPGTAWVESPRFSHPVVTRAGGFGGEGALTELLWGTLPS